MSAIEVRGAVKRFGRTPVLAEVDLSVPEGSITAVLGRSGSGKTTLLRIIAGFERLDGGSVSIGGALVDDGHRPVHAQRRGVGFVPQDGALFPHLSVDANVGFGLARSERGRVPDLLAAVGLEGLGGRRPGQLSGGQQQRVALARALAIRPRVVLLDEPFASLDAALRVSVRRDVARVLAETGSTAIIVTHDQGEALSMADRVAVLVDGRMLASAPPRDLYAAPPDAAAAQHLGDANLLPATVAGGVATCALGEVDVSAAAPDGTAVVLVRPEQVVVRPAPRAGLAGCAEPSGAAGVVVEREFYGHDALMTLRLDGPEGVVVSARIAGSREFDLGERVQLGVSGVGVVLDSVRS